jgi:hypothetical protein
MRGDATTRRRDETARGRLSERTTRGRDGGAQRGDATTTNLRNETMRGRCNKRTMLLREEALTGVIAAADTAVKGGGEEAGDLCKDCMLSLSDSSIDKSSSIPFSRT